MSLYDVDSTATVYRDQLPVPASALRIHEAIVAKLSKLVHGRFESCLDQRFRDGLESVYTLFDSFQSEVLAGSQATRSCAAGCSLCCFHWVEDVNSFEALIIAEEVKTKCPERVDTIVKRCEEDVLLLEKLDDIVTSKLADVDRAEIDVSSESTGIDPVDLLLSSFYQMQRPCPLLDTDGRCSIYSVRPMTCRIYMSLSNPSHCRPDYINEGEIPTYLLDLEEQGNALLDKLHFKYQRFEGDTGLRSLLLKHLKG